MSAVEDSLLPIDQGQDKALVDELWNLVNPGVSEFSTGMTLMQQLQCIDHVTDKYGKTLTIYPLYPSGSNNCIPTSHNFNEFRGPDLVIRHMTAAVNLVPLLNINSNHFILKRSDDQTAAADGKWFILDSCLNVDYDPDQWTVNQLENAAALIFGSGNQFGWAWTWS